MIVELYGLPGSGKTSLRNAVLGIESEKTDNNGIADFFLRTAKKVSVITPYAITKRRQISKIKIRNTEAVYLDISMSYKINNILMLAYGYKRLNSKNVFMDEGLIHRIIGLAVNHQLSEQQLTELINVFNDVLPARIYYLDVGLDECFNSIKRRNRHVSKMDELNNDELVLFLKDYEKYCNYICENYGHIRISRGDTEELKKIMIN